MKKLDYDYCHAARSWNGWARNGRWWIASTLNHLESEGLVERTSYESMPPCVEYSLTPLTRNFLREISYIVEWGQLCISRFLVARATILLLTFFVNGLTIFSSSTIGFSKFWTIFATESKSKYSTSARFFRCLSMRAWIFALSTYNSLP